MRGRSRGGGFGIRGADMRRVEKSSGGAVGNLVARRTLFLDGCGPTKSSSLGSTFMGGAGGGGVGCWTGSTGAGDLEDDAAAAAAAFELCCIAASAVALDALTPIRPAVGPVARILPPDGPEALPSAVSAPRPPLPSSAAGGAAAVVGVSSRVADPLVPISRPFSSSEKTISSAEKNVAGAGGGLTISGVPSSGEMGNCKARRVWSQQVAEEATVG